MACSRAYRLRIWPIVWALDLWFMVRWREPYGHCRRIAMRERLRRTDALDERLRLSEGL